MYWRYFVYLNSRVLTEKAFESLQCAADPHWCSLRRKIGFQKILENFIGYIVPKQSIVEVKPTI